MSFLPEALRLNTEPLDQRFNLVTRDEALAVLGRERVDERGFAALLSPVELEGLFDLGYHTKHVDTIFRRVFG